MAPVRTIVPVLAGLRDDGDDGVEIGKYRAEVG